MKNLIVDPSRDEIKLQVWDLDNNICCTHYRRNLLPIERLTNDIFDLASRWKVDKIMVDKAGIGAKISDFLMENKDYSPFKGKIEHLNRCGSL